MANHPSLQKNDTQNDSSFVHEGDSLLTDNVTRKLPPIRTLEAKLLEMFKGESKQKAKFRDSDQIQEMPTEKTRASTVTRRSNHSKRLLSINYIEDNNQEDSENAIFLEEEEEETRISFRRFNLCFSSYVTKKDQLFVQNSKPHLDFYT